MTKTGILTAATVLDELLIFGKLDELHIFGKGD